MILILSEHSDQSTNDVIEWLLKLEKPFLRINENDIIFIREINLQRASPDIIFSINKSDKIYSLKEFYSYWYRRGEINLSFSVEYQSLSHPIQDYLKKENYKLRQFFVTQLNLIPNKIGSLYDLNNNKLFNLKKAKDVGLSVPATFIVSDKRKALDLIQRKKYRLISKSIYNNIDFWGEETLIRSYTSIVSQFDLKKIGTQFFPSLLQQFIDKSIDLRVFYLKGKCWGMAIFSQKDEKTKIDFRNYNTERPNRVEPWKLDNSLVQKITTFMKLLNLDTGSLDFVISKKNKAYFLEVNPVGQFGMTSYPCNFNLEREIAKRLANFDYVKQ